jgi:hypothetical protein
MSEDRREAYARARPDRAAARERHARLKAGLGLPKADSLTPRPPRAAMVIDLPRDESGPGSTLKRWFAAADRFLSLLARGLDRFGLATAAARVRALDMKEQSGCGCKSMARTMDAWGVEGCRANMGAIVGHLEAQAKTRGIPAPRWATTALVRLALWRSRSHRAPAPPPTSGTNAWRSWWPTARPGTGSGSPATGGGRDATDSGQSDAEVRIVTDEENVRGGGLIGRDRDR